MKVFLATLSLAGSLLLAGCEHDMPPAAPRTQTGQVPGAIVQPDRSDDPFTREVSRVGN